MLELGSPGVQGLEKLGVVRSSTVAEFSQLALTGAAGKSSKPCMILNR